MWAVRRAIKQRSRVWEGERGARRQHALDRVNLHQCSTISEEGAGGRLTQRNRFFGTTHCKSPSPAQPDLSCLPPAQFCV